MSDCRFFDMCETAYDIGCDGSEDTACSQFEPMLDAWKLLEGNPSEYIVVNPMTFEVRLKDGEVIRYPQDVRERIVRCRDCGRAYRRGGGVYCSRVLQWGSNDRPAPLPVDQDGFCAWGERRDGRCAIG